MLLLHARKCQRNENAPHEALRKCLIIHCDMYKELHNHMASCQEGSSCPYLRCTSSRQILSHWKNCLLKNCCVCLPLKCYKNDDIQEQNHLEGNMSTSLLPCGNLLATAPTPEKMKLIQHQLVYLLHAHKCRLKENRTDGEGHRNCALPHCSLMKEVLDHMVNCITGKSCPFPHCVSSRRIIIHWKNCRITDCSLCSPLKHVIQEQTDVTPSPEPQNQVLISQPTSFEPKSTTWTFAEMQRLVQDQLLVLLHAQKCLAGENGYDGEKPLMCSITHCRTFKKLVSHVKTCQSGKCCSFPYCWSSGQIIAHWENCVSQYCLVCSIV